MVLKQTKITDFYYHLKIKKIYGYNEKTFSWHCITCGTDMGIHNPRQLCGKYYCPDAEYLEFLEKC
jgi:ribosomal protein S27AE